jgi:hypothetical protein
MSSATKQRKPMETENRIFRAQHLIVMDASGILDLNASKVALAKLAADPEFNRRSEILVDLRDIECHMSASDIYDLAVALGWPDPALPTHRRIAILVEGRDEFDHAQFLAMCAANRGVEIAAFDDYEKADRWMTVELPPDPKEGEGDVPNGALSHHSNQDGLPKT